MQYSILINRSYAIGDVFIASQVIPFLRKNHPQARIDFSTYCPDALHGVEGIAQIIHPNAASKNKYDKIIDLDLAYERMPKKSIYEAYANVVGCSADDLAPNCVVPLENRQHAISVMKREEIGHRPFVVLHAGASFWVRIWPAPFFAEVIERLSNSLDVDFITCGSLKDPYINGTHDLRNIGSLMTTVSIINESSAFLGMDSSLLHFAKALGKPVCAIFGPTDPKLRLRPSEKDLIFSSSVACKYCHHRQRPPAFITVCLRQNPLYILVDSLLQVHYRSFYARKKFLNAQTISLLWRFVCFRENGGKYACCQKKILPSEVAHRLVTWLSKMLK